MDLVILLSEALLLENPNDFANFLAKLLFDLGVSAVEVDSVDVGVRAPGDNSPVNSSTIVSISLLDE